MKIQFPFGRFAVAASLFTCLSAPAATTVIVTVNPNGTFTPARVDLYTGDTVEWRFASRSDNIVPVNLDAAGQPDVVNYKPYVATDPNEFTGPLPHAVSGIYALSPEDRPYVTQTATWQSANLAGVFIRPRWDDVHLGPGQYFWNEIDAEIDKAVANGKVYSIGFKAGSRGTPQWLFDSTKTTATVPPLDFGLKENNKTVFLGSPADANYRKHYFDLLRAFAAHLREHNSRYRALGYIKIAGVNLITHENRLPNDTVADLATWASAGKYTPTALLAFYRDQTALLATEFPDKDMSYALIQDGFPIVNDFGEYQGQPGPLLHPLPGGTDQTEAVMAQGRTAYGRRFVVQHNGLQEKPAFCPGSTVHPIVTDNKFHYVGSGCPNSWVLDQATAGQVTGFQDVAGLPNLAALESSFQNMLDNSDGIFLEIYESSSLAADAAFLLPSGQTLGQWNERFHQRRRTAWASIPDPFPLIYRHTFTRAASAVTGPQLLQYVNAPKCRPGANNPYGTVAILAVSITSHPQSIAVSPGSSAQFSVAVSGPSGLAYDWQKSTNAGVTWTSTGQSATATSLAVSSVALADNGTRYRVVVTGPDGPLTSNVATLTVLAGGVPVAPPAIASSITAFNAFSATWQAATGATGYRIDVAVDAAFTTFVAGFQNLDVGNVLSTNITGLSLGTYYFRIRGYNALGAGVSSTTGTSTVGGRAINISSRGLTATGDNVMIAGFVIGGSGPKQLLIRAVGPTLAVAPFNLAGTVANPRLRLQSSDGGPSAPVVFYDNWNPADAALVAATNRLGAFSLVSGSLDASALVTLDPGNYSAQVETVTGATGIAIVEIYETGSEGRLINLSTRGFVGTGDSILIQGTVVTGGPKRLLVRAVGETLTTPPFNLSGVLIDPMLDIYSSSAPGAPLFSNDNWGTNANATEIAAVARAVGAFALGANSRDAVLLLTLDSGGYSFQVRGKSGATGIVIVELYEVP